MKLHYPSLLKFIILIGLVVSSDCMKESNEWGESERFLNFLADATHNFSDWVRENNFDPSPINPMEYKLDINSYPGRFNLTLELRDEQILGYGHPSSHSEGAGLSMALGTIMMQQFSYGPIMFQGSFSANGTDTLGYPLCGEGKWTWELINLVFERIEYTFTISSDGFIVISNPPDFYILDTMLSNTNLTFENFGGWGVVDNSILIAIYNKYVAWYPEHPAGSLMHRYFTELFKKTPYNEIISYQGSQLGRAARNKIRTSNGIYIGYNATSSLRSDN